MKNTKERYNYEIPIWAVAALCFAALAVSLLSFAGFYYWHLWAGEAPIFFKWFLFLMGSVFLVIGIKPNNWKPWRYFYADIQGIHFPSKCPETRDTKWLLVPWERVGAIKKEKFVDLTIGPSIELKLSEDEINQFFRNLKLTKMSFGHAVREDGYFKVGYSNAFKNVDNAVRILNDFRKRAGSE